MSISYRIQNVLLPQSWSEDKQKVYIETKNFDYKFGNKRNRPFEIAQQENQLGFNLMDLEDGAKAYVERKKVTYKTKRQRKIKLDGINSYTTETSSSDPDQGKMKRQKKSSQ